MIKAYKMLARKTVGKRSMENFISRRITIRCM
jgi:hypothetical protein